MTEPGRNRKPVPCSWIECKENVIMIFATTGIDPETIILSEVSQTKKDKYCMVSFIC